MRVLHLLRFLISLLFAGFGLSYIVFFLMGGYTLFSEHEIPSFININFQGRQIINPAGIESFELMIIYFFSYLILMSLALGSLYFLRKFVYDIKPRNFFTEKQTIYLKRIGQLIILSTTGKFLFAILWSLFFENEENTTRQHISFNFPDLFDSEYYIIGIGLFFLFLSKLFSIAQRQKEENELTI